MYYFGVRFCDWMDVLLPLAGIDNSEPLSLFCSPIGRLPLGRAVGQGAGDDMKRLNIGVGQSLSFYWIRSAVFI